jgi:hypothetical protein
VVVKRPSVVIYKESWEARKLGGWKAKPDAITKTPQWDVKNNGIPRM